MNDVAKIDKSEHSIGFRNKSLSENSKGTYTVAVKQYVAFISDNNLKAGIDSVVSWLNTFDNAKTYNIKLQGIKEYLLDFYSNENAAKRLELLEKLNAIKRKRPKMSVERTDYIDYSQFQTFSKNTTKRTSLIIQALFWSGCRISELLDIKVSDCLRAENYVTARVRDGKGGAERQVYLPISVYDNVVEYFKGKEYLFESSKGQLNRCVVTREIAFEAQKILGIKISAHTLRHSKAMYLKNEKNLSADQIAKALGHKSVTTTLTSYFHGTPSAEDQGIV